MCAYGVGWPEGAVGMAGGTRISLMLAVPSAAAAAGWYERALGATELWNLGGVVGLEIEGAPFFLHEPAGTGFGSPATLGATTVRVSTTVRVRCSAMPRTRSSPGPWRRGLTAHLMRSKTIRRHGAFTGREDSPTRSVMSGLSATSLR